MISAENKSDLDKLLAEYNALPFYKKWFYPWALSTALKLYEREGSPASAFAVCEAYLNKTWFFQRWFFPSIYNSLESSGQELGRVFSYLSDYGLLTGDMAQANLNAVVAHRYPLRVADALRKLNNDGLLTGDMAQANRDAVVAHAHPLGVADALRELNRDGLLTGDMAQANRDAVAAHTHPLGVADALRELNRDGLLTGDMAQANRDAVVAHGDPPCVADALRKLNNDGLLTGDMAQANRDAVVAHGDRDIQSLAHILYELSHAGLLTGDMAQANFDAVVAHRDTLSVEYILRKLNNDGLLTGDMAQANFDAVVAHTNPWDLAGALRKLSHAGLLTGDMAQANFNHVAITYSDIVSHPETLVFLNQIHPHLFTLARWEAMIAICEANHTNPAEGRRLIEHYINHDILGIGRPGVVRAINDRQSTHTASIHATASESALKLKEQYGTLIDGTELDRVLTEEMFVWLSEESDTSLKIKAAKRCFLRLNSPFEAYTDEVSQVSIRQLLALTWLAFNDETQRIGSLGEAKVALIEGLYEAQRAYNLSEVGVDDNSDEDEPACVAGTFNKILEKGCGLHPNITLKYITPELATLKFIAVANEKAVACLDELMHTSEGRQDLFRLAELIKANGNSIEPLWDNIEADVTATIFEEFNSLYDNNKESPKFVALVSCGKDVELGKTSLEALDTLITRAKHVDVVDGLKARAQQPSIATLASGFFAPVTDSTDNGVVKDNGVASCLLP
jgi:predicted MarR family transcription regulator